MAAVSALALCLAVVAVVGGGGEARHTNFAVYLLLHSRRTKKKNA